MVTLLLSGREKPKWTLPVWVLNSFLLAGSSRCSRRTERQGNLYQTCFPQRALPAFPEAGTIHWFPTSYKLNLFLNQDFPPGPSSEGSRSRWGQPLRNHRKGCKGLWSLARSWKTPLEKGMATQSSILVWRIPRTEGPGRLYSLRGCKESDTTERITQKQGECRGQPTGGGCIPSAEGSRVDPGRWGVC